MGNSSEYDCISNLQSFFLSFQNIYKKWKTRLWHLLPFSDNNWQWFTDFLLFRTNCQSLPSPFPGTGVTRTQICWPGVNIMNLFFFALNVAPTWRRDFQYIDTHQHYIWKVDTLSNINVWPSVPILQIRLVRRACQNKLKCLSVETVI